MFGSGLLGWFLFQFLIEDLSYPSKLSRSLIMSSSFSCSCLFSLLTTMLTKSSLSVSRTLDFCHGDVSWLFFIPRVV